jgi:hypothetical protein
MASAGEEGCKSRWNAKYRGIAFPSFNDLGLGLNRMAPLFQTDSVGDEFSQKLEKELTEYFGDVANVVKGSGGGTGQAPFVVYVAWQEED